jgi:hydrogenase maturation factor
VAVVGNEGVYSVGEQVLVVLGVALQKVGENAARQRR